MRPYSEASERNRAPILAVLKRVFASCAKVLEIGSGTGQHAAYFAPELPHLVWQPSDVAAHLPGIALWVHGIRNVARPIPLNVDDAWPSLEADAAFSANTCHIMSWPQVERMVDAVARMLPAGGLFALYGPFHYGGQPTSPGNARFDAMLRSQDPASGIRDVEAIVALGERHALRLEEDNAMPANNRLLVFRKRAGDGAARPL